MSDELILDEVDLDLEEHNLPFALESMYWTGIDDYIDTPCCCSLAVAHH